MKVPNQYAYFVVMMVNMSTGISISIAEHLVVLSNDYKR